MDFYISLSGKVLKRTSDDRFQVFNTVLEEDSARNLLKLFKNNDELTREDGDTTLKNLIESMTRLALAQVNIAEDEEKDKDTVVTEDTIEDTVVNEDINDVHKETYNIHFHNSLLIGDKKEYKYPLYILKPPRIPVLKLGEDNSAQVQQFYNENSGSELALFSHENVYEILYNSTSKSVDLEAMIKSLKGDNLKLSDLTDDQVQDFQIDWIGLQEIFDELIESKVPSKKVEKLKELQTKITSVNPQMNSDLLLPILTHVVINVDRGHLISRELEFIEKYSDNSCLTGLDCYILTSTVRGIAM